MRKNTVCLFLFSSLLSISGMAENRKDSTQIGRNYVIDEVVVTGTRNETDIRHLPMTISIVNRQQIEKRYEPSLLPLLTEQVPGLFTTSRGIMGYGVSTGAAGGMSLRGIGGSPTAGLLVLIDGHPQYMGLMGHPIADAYQSMLAERVEVLRGPASVLYGSNAMGGVINIVTRKQQEEGVKNNMQVGYGSYNTLQTEFSNRVKKGCFSSVVTGSYNRTDGHRSDMEFEQYGGYAKLGYDLSTFWKVWEDINVTHFNASNPGTVQTPLFDNDSRITRGMTSFALENHYEKTLNVLKKLEDKGIQTVLSTSCSLQHVPYTLKHENKLSDEYLNYFAFAEEKLVELKELSVLAECGNIEEDERFKTNRKLFAGTRKCDNEAVKKRLAEVTEADYRRLPARSERQQLQKKEFALPKLPTTTIGSFPQTKDVKANRSAFRKGEISEEQYVEFNKKKIEECVRWQEKIGLDVLVHGEYERNDMVEYFGEALGGFLFTEKAWVQSYGTRCVKPPVIWGDVYRKKPITVEWSVYAQSLTDKIMKGMLTGPVTILNWSFPREDITIKESISQIALAIRDEVLDLEANGIKIIQIDEAALREKLPLRKSDWNTEYLDFAIPAFRLTASGVKPETQIHTHMCYSEFTDIIPAIDDMDADVITFEASRSDLQILDSLRENNFETEVGPGVYDIHSPRIPSVEEITRAIKIMLTKIDKDKLWVNPDCGLKTRGVPETEASLKNMVKAAEIIRAEL